MCKTAGEIISSQKKYLMTGGFSNINRRERRLKELLVSVNDHESEIADALKKDLGKSDMEALMTEIAPVKEEIRFMLSKLKSFQKPKKVKTPFTHFPASSYVLREPYGSILIISPWNYPFQLTMMPLVGAIAAGNCAIIKPSENAIATSKIIAKIIKETFEAEYICCILGDVSTTIQLTHSQVDHIFFTGSIGTGKKIMAAASEQLIPVTLELGGKSPVIVDQSAKLKDAVQKIAWGKILNAGQTCVAPDYLIIKEELKDKFIELWKETVNIFLSNDDYGRIINEKHFKRLIKMFEGEEIYAGGNYNADDLWIEPTLVNGNKSNFMNEEIFGPILPIITYKDRNEIEILVEKHPFPLALYIFSNDKQFINYLTKRLSFGGACINDCITHLISPKVPFGGIRYSGIGQYHGKDSFITFSHKQTTHYRFIKKDLVSLYPPYSKRLYKLVTKILK